MTDIDKINSALAFIADLEPNDHVMSRIIDRLVIQQSVMSPARTAKPQYDKVTFSR